ncbi:xylulokinase [Timonella senegalensis]|uniref:xylulokinase n=1 Tax=Timonella senegalensis TaxID=1465825 RepID=UPI0028AB9E49|nr:FGGY-family carbohydrate kinase [Timonella senegalensis]
MTTASPSVEQIRAAIESGDTALGIELGSTRIKASLILTDGTPIAAGAHDWENEFVDKRWTYSLESVERGMQDAYASLVTDIESQYGVRPATFGALGVSAMMHGYLAFNADNELLVPFRTWRNTSTGPAAAELSELLNYNIPLRWSVAHWYQAILEEEAHVPEIAFLTTLAGYVHYKLTGNKVLGVGDASGMFPVDPATRNYDVSLLELVDQRVATRRQSPALADLLPTVLVAGQDAGRLTEAGAAWLDPTGTLTPGIITAPPEGDAGTGMVATNAVAPRTGNVSAGTSIFSMVVLEQPLASRHHELDLVTTPVGDLVAMVHCNNGASELNAWAGVFGEYAKALGFDISPDQVFEAFFRAALAGEADGGGLLGYNYLSGEPITGLEEGRPLFVRTPDSTLNLPNFARTQINGAFATLALGMKVLAGEGVAIENMFAHGGMFRTAGVAQRLLAAAINAPVSVGHTAGEGGAWGIAVLSAFTKARAAGLEADLFEYLTSTIFASAEINTVTPAATDVAGFATYLEQYTAGLDIERAAVTALNTTISQA